MGDYEKGLIPAQYEVPLSTRALCLGALSTIRKKTRLALWNMFNSTSRAERVRFRQRSG